MTNKEMLRALRNSFLWGLAVLTLAAMIIVTLFPGEEKSPDSKFKVIDHYRGCDVVQYNRTNLSNYIYFLDCR